MSGDYGSEARLNPNPPGRNIYRREFYASHIANLKKIGDCLTSLEQWADEQETSLVHATDVLINMSDSMRRIRDGIYLDPNTTIDTLRPKYEVAIGKIIEKAAAFRLQYQERKREMAVLGDDLVPVSAKQEELRKYVEGQLPQYYWGSSKPMSKILECGDLLETHRMRLKDQITPMKLLDKHRQDLEAEIRTARTVLKYGEEPVLGGDENTPIVGGSSNVDTEAEGEEEEEEKEEGEIEDEGESPPKIEGIVMPNDMDSDNDD
ncbi:hypothetical protein ABW21_db0203913 [Orbilia brochopaga]|nr:hypothetical protein ABW21_db0203913 [Drechslerella brochopaga]